MERAQPLTRRVIACWLSFRTLPTHLQVWVAGVLMPINAASLLFLDTFSGRVTALALVAVLAVNLPLMLHHQAMNRNMSLVHLLAWLPLELVLLAQLAGLCGDQVLTPWQWGFTVAVIMVNAVSLFFDLVDAWCWAQTQRPHWHPDSVPPARRG